MANKHLSGKPHKIKKQPDAWWYEEPQGIIVIVHKEALSSMGAANIDIPWKTLRAALARKDRS